MKKSGAVLLRTERLILRRFKTEDVSSVFRNWSGNPNVTKYLLWSYHKTEKETEKFIRKYVRQYYRKSFYVWAVELKENGEVIGTVDATTSKRKAEIGYCFGENFWGQGYAFEALSEMMRFLKEEGCDEFGATCAVENMASDKLLLKLGMKKQEGIIPLIGPKGILKCAEYELKC